MNKLTQEEASHIIDTVTEFQLGAEKVYRFVGNPYVEGDNVAEHTARIVRLAIYIMPFLLSEFKNHPDRDHLAEDIYVTVLTHDDEEIVQGFDIVTFLKNHDSRNQEEIDSVKNKMSRMPLVSQDYVMDKFISFREQDTLVSQIGKILDHIAGNQTKIEQKLGIVNPDGAKFSIDYVEKYKGVSETMDTLIDNQIKNIVSYREFAKNSNSEIELLVDIAEKQENCIAPREELKLIIKKLLEIEILSYELDKNKIALKIWEYK